MNTEALIEHLVSTARPVTPLKHPVRRLASWLAVALPLVAIATYLLVTQHGAFGPRLDFEDLVQVGLMLLLALTAAASAMFLSVPDRTRSILVLVPCLILVAWTASLATSVLSANGGLQAGTGLRCLRNIIVLSVVPAWFMHRLLRSAFTLRVRLTTTMALLSASALACAATRFICPDEDPLHFLVWHYCPTVSLGILGALWQSMPATCKTSTSRVYRSKR